MERDVQIKGARLYRVPVDSRAIHPDFLILNPRRGLLVLEVKDWKADTIRSIDRFSVTLLVDARQKQAANPLEQAKQYAYGVKDVLERDPALLSEPGTPSRPARVPMGLRRCPDQYCEKDFRSGWLG